MNYSNLTDREKKYLRIMEVQKLVLNLIGAPGLAKSAIVKSISDKIGAIFIDLRLATMDETDLGVYPVIRNQEQYPVLHHAVPHWAEMTNDKTRTFVICFEELNRASKSVRDAALGVLLERRIGYNFMFGDNVLMVATGNLGSADGTEVEELDTALKSRLITIEHQMELDEWISSYAEKNVHKDIVRYLKAHPSHYYPDIKNQDANGKVIVNPRTWDALSAYILKHFGPTANVDVYGGDVDRVATHYIGSMGMNFMKWLRDHFRVTIKDVLDGKIKTKADFNKIERENLTELAGELKAITIPKITEKQLPHVINLLRAMDQDVMYGAVWDLFKSDDDNKNKVTESFLKEFRTELKHLVTRHQEAAKTNESENK